IAARVGRRPQPRDHLFGRNQRPLQLVAALLGAGLILDLDRGGAGRLELAHRALHLQQVAVAVVGVGDDRQIHDRGGAPHPLRHLAQGDEAQVRQPQRRGRLAVAGQVDAGEAGLLDQQRREHVVGAGRDHDPVPAQQVAQRGAAPRAVVHGSTSHARRERATLYSPTASTIAIPLITICQMLGTSSSASPLASTPMKTAPITASSTLPTPPLSAIPPTTTAAITSSSAPLPWYGTAIATCAVISTPASPAQAPAAA